MSSLAALTHTAAPPAFNGLFFATAATIIPVLFLAIAVQGRTYQNLVNGILAATRRMVEATSDRERTRAAGVPPGNGQNGFSIGPEPPRAETGDPRGPNLP
jgi:hypothetical protein